MYLLDTNIWLEILLEQKNFREAILFFEKIETENIHITEFSVYSIGIILSRYKKIDVYKVFIFDLIYESSVDIIRLKDNDHFKIIEAMENYSWILMMPINTWQPKR